MNKFAPLAVLVVSFASFACAAGDPSQTLANGDPAGEDVASTEQPLCTNVRGAAAILASLAVATAKELKRWNAPQDFKWNATSGMLELSATGKARCTDGVCRNVQALLDMQKPEANNQVMFPDGVVLDSYALRGAIQHHYDRQTRCNNYWGEYLSNGCWVEPHQLSYWKDEPGVCAQDDYFYVKKPGTSTNLDAPQRLNYQLYFAGYPDNPFLNFRNNSSSVVIDPTVGLTEGDTTSLGSCTDACTQYSTTSLTGTCCACNGTIKKFARSPFSASMYLCK